MARADSVRPASTADPERSIDFGILPPVTFQRTAAEGTLLIADISGYTSFFRDVEEMHRDDAFANGATPPAYELMSSLLGAIVECIVPPFTLAKIEGDAVFTFAGAADAVPHGDELLDVIQRCYDRFAAGRDAGVELTTCTCDACSRAGRLDLKFILHSGTYVLQEIAGSRELSGPDVVMAHRLLKNQAADAVGSSAYLLATDVAARRLEVPTANAVPITETYEHYAPIDAFALALTARDRIAG